MKATLEQLIAQALLKLDIEPSAQPIILSKTRAAAHGDFACNIAMLLAKQRQQPPRQLAEAIVANIDSSAAFISKIEIAGAGFINFFLAASAQHAVLAAILQAGADYGRADLGAGASWHLEYVSANPTGPLHVGHGRGAAYGAALARLLQVAGYQVHSEYYVNDAGRQMHILAASIWLRYLQQCDVAIDFAANGYRGAYVTDLASQLKAEHGERLCHRVAQICADLPADAGAGGDKEQYIDALIARAQQLLGADYQLVFDFGCSAIVADIKDDLSEFGVHFDRWFYESELVANGSVERALAVLAERGYLYEQAGATWFKTKELGDEKDRVVIRDNGVKTYFASDIAYHHDKLQRGFARIVDILGADHHGYEPRVRASIVALGGEQQKFAVRFVQFAALFRGSEKLPMSTRAGEFVTLRELRNEVGNDAARFFYTMRKCEQHMDFDLELAKSHSSDNPVYYVQYAHARICGVFAQLGLDYKNFAWQAADFSLLSNEHEQALIRKLGSYAETVCAAASAGEPHQLSYYLRELAQALHSYYNAHKINIAASELKLARLALIAATRQVLANALWIIGVSAPESM